MANNYESLKTDGHYTMARRIFTKIKSWVENKVKTDVPANAVFTDHIYTAGDNVDITNGVISSDQIEDSYNYQQYQNLPTSTKMKDALFIVDDAPDLDPAILNLVYPVGTYYETSDTTFDPNVTWGGTWILEDEGLVHISSGTNYVVSANAQDGGETTHTLTVDEMPSHGHYTYVRINKGSSGGPANSSITSSSNWWNVQENAAGYATGIVSIGGTGGGQAHNNMQPYKIVNRWHRTA